MLFFYGVGLILLLISVPHIMNSISSMVLSRRHEFGILRAMGISDRGYMRMMLKEALRYGIYASLVMAAVAMPVRAVLKDSVVEEIRR